MKSPFKKSGTEIKVKMAHEDRAVISDFLMQISGVAMTDQSLAWRLFPPLYSDPVAQAEHDLSAEGKDHRPVEISRSFALSAALLTDKELLTIEEANSVLQDLNRSRLVMAEIIGINDDSFDPGQLASDQLKFAFDVYNYFGWIVTELTEVMADTNPNN